MIWLVLGIGLIILFVYIYMVKPFQYWKRNGVTQYGLLTIYKELLLGFIPYRSLVESVEKIYNDFSDERYIGSYQFALPALVLRDPELIKQLTIKDFNFFTDHFNPLSETTDKIWVRNLFALPGDKWKNMRMILRPYFSSGKLKTIYPLITDCAKQLVQHFDKMEDSLVTVEMKAIFSKFTNDVIATSAITSLVIATSAFGISCNSLEDSNNDFFIMGKEITNFSGILVHLKLITLVILPKIAQILGFQIYSSKLVNYFENLIMQSIENREKHGIVRRDMIQLLLDARRKTNGYEEIVEEENEIYAIINDKENKTRKIQLTDEDIMSQAFLFFFAGFETVSAGMSFMVHELAVNPEVQEKLFEEIQENTRKFGKDPTYENLMKMKYLDMVISESLRKNPPAGRSDRVCVKPYTILPTGENKKPIYLEVGTIIWLPIWALHRNPKYFPNPDRFDPERFNNENKSSIIPGSYLPFGIGPRYCIGNRFALMEMKLALYYILSKYKFVVVDETQIPLKLDRSQISVNAEKGFWLGLEKRVIR